jgi:large subunit GTPase 1
MLVAMVLPKSRNTVGLGNSLLNDRFGKGKTTDQRRGTNQGIERRGVNGEKYVTNNKQEASWMKMRSVTEQAALDEFLSTAELAGTDFTAEKLNNVKIIHRDQKNPFLLSAAEELATKKKHHANKKRLTVPRRPYWNETTTLRELDEQEKESLLEWRRGLAELQESNDLLLTPFERNIEVWRQLWRVIERSDLVVQIVDARNPLLFRCEDLEKYVKEVESKKNNLLLVNKADMMTLAQRQAWADYFQKAGINFRFFSAELAKEMNETMDMTSKTTDDVENQLDPEDHLVRESRQMHIQEAFEEDEQDEGVDLTDSFEYDADPTQILTTDELEALFLQHAPEEVTDAHGNPRKIQIGLVGYPNVGKSSTINALIGAKKVSVSATPGKTKHFQTIHLSDRIILCDCPGLVFPNFASTKAELVCNGILPIDQLREYTGPVGLVAQRIPQDFLEAMYGMKIHTRPLEEGGTGIPTAEEVLRAYAIARGFSTQGFGQPDESRAARFILKDYVKGKLLFCHPPPVEPPIDTKEFNRELYSLVHLSSKRRSAMAANTETSLNNGEDPSLMGDLDVIQLPSVQGAKSKNIDKKFFSPSNGDAGHVLMHKYSERGRLAGKQPSGRKQRAMIALEQGIDPSEVRLNGKKHFKGNKRKGKVKASYD